jgi:hypothetical protein
MIGSMQLRVLTTVTATAFVVCSLACSPPPPAEPTLDEIVASHIEARGGAERLQGLTSLRASGTATTSGGRVAKVVQEIKRPGFYRLEFTAQGTTAVYAHDGEVGWQVAPLDGILEPSVVVPEEDSDAGVDERDIEGPLLNWREKGHLVELVGREMLPGGEAFTLRITLSDGGVRTDYIDVESRQLVRADKTEVIRGRALRMEETYGDYREVEGLMLPHFIETTVTNRPEVISIAVDRFEINPELDDTRFRLPE